MVHYCGMAIIGNEEAKKIGLKEKVEGLKNGKIVEWNGDKRIERHLASLLIPYSGNRKEFIESYNAVKHPFHPETDREIGNNFFKLDWFGLGSLTDQYDSMPCLPDKKHAALQVKDVLKEDGMIARGKLMAIAGFLDKYGAFSIASDYCTYDHEKNERICDQFKILDFNDPGSELLTPMLYEGGDEPSLSPDDWIVGFHYHV